MSTASSSALTASPAGTPSTVTPSVGPCDSPAVRNRSRPTESASVRRGGLARRALRARITRRLAFGRSEPGLARLAELVMHEIQRRLLAGPELERRRALVEQHQLAVGDGA